MFHRHHTLKIATVAAILTMAVSCSSPSHPAQKPRAFYREFPNLGTFERPINAQHIAWTSPSMQTPDWDELIVSWNAECPGTSGLKIEARAFDGAAWTRFYTLGLWTERADPARRCSVRGQRDGDGVVRTDTLVCSRVMKGLQLRITADRDGDFPRVKQISASFLNSSVPAGQSPAGHGQPGEILEVPQRSQIAYPGGSGWCSPTCVSMILAYWAQRLSRPELDVAVPTVAAAVHDPNWPGTGNWPFNTAFAGKYPGMRAFVARLDGLGEVEQFIARGIPVALSVSFDLLNGRAADLGNGHLIVAVGFDAAGDVVVNDPWPNPKGENSVRKVFPRERVMAAWQRSKQAAYVIYPARAAADVAAVLRTEKK